MDTLLQIGLAKRQKYKKFADIILQFWFENEYITQKRQFLTKNVPKSQCSHGHIYVAKSIKWLDILLNIWLENNKNKKYNTRI